MEMKKADLALDKAIESGDPQLGNNRLFMKEDKMFDDEGSCPLRRSEVLYIHWYCQLFAGKCEVYMYMYIV